MRGKHPFVPLEFEELPEEEMRRRAREFFETMNRRRTPRGVLLVMLPYGGWVPWLRFLS